VQELAMACKLSGNEESEVDELASMISITGTS